MIPSQKGHKCLGLIYFNGFQTCVIATVNGEVIYRADPVGKAKNTFFMIFFSRSVYFIQLKLGTERSSAQINFNPCSHTRISEMQKAVSTLVLFLAQLFYFVGSNLLEIASFMGKTNLTLGLRPKSINVVLLL